LRGKVDVTLPLSFNLEKKEGKRISFTAASRGASLFWVGSVPPGRVHLCLLPEREGSPGSISSCCAKGEREKVPLQFFLFVGRSHQLTGRGPAFFHLMKGTSTSISSMGGGGRRTDGPWTCFHFIAGGEGR